MTKFIPYAIAVFAILASAAFLRKAFFVGEISAADCAVVIFALFLVFLIYGIGELIAFKTSEIEAESVSDLRSKVDSELIEIRRSIELLSKGSSDEGGGF